MLKKIFITLIVLVMIPIMTFQVAAANGDFINTFEDSNTDNWDTSGAWSIYNDEGNNVFRRGGAEGLATISTKYAQYENFEASVDIKANQWGSTIDNNFGFVLKETAGDNFYFLEYSDLAKVLRLRRFINGAESVLFIKTEYQLSTSVWHNFKIRFLDGYLTVDVDQTPEIALKDTQLKMGNFKVSTYNVDVSIDNFSIKYIEAPFVDVDLDFDDGSTEGIIPGTWAIKNGALAAPDNNVYSSIETAAAYGDFTISFDIQSRIVNAGPDGNMGIAVRKNGDLSYFLEYNVIYNFYQIRKFTAGGGALVLAYIPNKILAPEQWTNNIIEVKGRNIKWYVDGQLLMDVTDNDTSYYKSGSIFLQGYQCSPAIDNLKIAKIIEIPTEKSFFADFEDGYTGNFIISNYSLADDGTKVLNTASTGTIDTLYQKYEDFTFDVDFKINAMVNPADGNFGVIFKQNDNANDFYFIEYNPQNKFFQVRRVVNNNWETCIILKRVEMELSIGAWHKLKVVSLNQNITVSIDETQQASFVNDLVVQGGLRINTYNNEVSVDNIRMQALNKTAYTFDTFDKTTWGNGDSAGNKATLNFVTTNKYNLTIGVKVDKNLGRSIIAIKDENQNIVDSKKIDCFFVTSSWVDVTFTVNSGGNYTLEITADGKNYTEIANVQFNETLGTATAGNAVVIDGIVISEEEI